MTPDTYYPGGPPREFPSENKEALDLALAPYRETAAGDYTILPDDSPDQGLTGYYIFRPKRDDVDTPKAGWYYYPTYGKRLEPHHTNCDTLEKLHQEWTNCHKDGKGNVELAEWPERRAVGFRYDGDALSEGVMTCCSVRLGVLRERYGRELTKGMTWPQQLAFHLGMHEAHELMKKVFDKYDS